MSVLENNGDGTFAEQSLFAVGDMPASVAIGDLDGDGVADLSVANAFSNTVSVLLNSGDGSFAAGALVTAGNSPGSVAIGDMDADGDLDVVVANFESNNVSVLLNQCADAPDRKSVV